MTNTRAGAAAWTQTRAGAVEQVGGDGRPARLSHEVAWTQTRAGAVEQVGGDGRPARLSHEVAWRRTRAGAMGVWPPRGAEVDEKAAEAVKASVRD